jgi:hypothetical protein
MQARRKASRKREKAARKKRPAQEKKVAGPVVGVQPLNQRIEPPISVEKGPMMLLDKLPEPPEDIAHAFDKVHSVVYYQWQVHGQSFIFMFSGDSCRWGDS